MKIRNPLSLGIVRGSGAYFAHHNYPTLADFRVVCLRIKNVGKTSIIVGYRDMDVENEEGILDIVSPGEICELQQFGGQKMITLGDIVVVITSDEGSALITALLE